MMRLALTLAFVFALAIVTPAAEEKAALNYEHLKVLEPFFGPWVYEGHQDEIPGLPGRVPRSGSLRYRWSLTRQDCHGLVDPGPGGNLFRNGPDWLECQRKQITSCQLTSAGFCASSVWSVDGKTLRIEGQEIGPDGVETSSVVFNKLTDRGTMIWQATNVLRDGEKQPDSPESEFRPRKR